MLRKALILCVISYGLYGCAAGVLAVGAGSSALLYDERNLSTIYQDQKIVHQAHALVKKNPTLEKTHLSFSSINHRLLITGQTPKVQQRVLIGQLVKKIPRVKEVINKATVAHPLPPVAISKDLWITSKIKAAMLQKPHLHSAQIKVVTENKVVYLMGIVSKRQAHLATQIAQKTLGINKVVQLFEVIT